MKLDVSNLKQPSEDYDGPPYVASLSRQVRAGCRLTGADLRKLVEGLVKRFDSDPELVKSLKGDGPPKEGRLLRQIDIRPEPGHPVILLKCFMSWSWEINCWHVFVEGPDETAVEDGRPNF